MEPKAMEKDMLTDRDIDRLFYTTADMIYETDMQHGDGRYFWPFHPAILDSIVAPFVFEELYRLFKLLEDKGYSVERIAKLFKSPTRVATYQYLWSGGGGTIRKIPKGKKYYLVSMFTKILRILRHDEPFCENFRNLAWTEREAQAYVTKHKKDMFDIKKQSEAGKLIAKIEGRLMSYCELLYYYMLDFSRFFHGPYLAKGNKIFVKEYLDLQAGEMWDLVSDFPFNHFREIGLYPKEMMIHIFFMGHTHAKPSFPEALERSVLEIDGKPITSVKELKKCYEEMNKVVDKVVVEVTKRHNDEEFLLKTKTKTTPSLG